MLQTLFFRDLDGKSLTLRDVSIDTKMKDVFHRLGQEKAIDTEWLRFIWSGKQLSGGALSRLSLRPPPTAADDRGQLQAGPFATMAS